MTLGDSPAVARRRVRLAVREAREAKNLTQSHVAEAMEWSLSKVMRIESGEVAVAPNDLKPLLAFIGVTEPAHVAALLDDARLAKRRRLWSDELRFREHLTPAVRQLIQYEAEARAVRHFHQMLIPGRLQTESYARAVLDVFRAEIGDAVIETRIESRLRRRADMLARKKPPKIYLLLDEGVLHREVGGSQVIGEQLADLVRLSDDIGVVVRIVPFTAAAPRALFGPFDLLEMDREDDAVLYREDSMVDKIIEDEAEIQRHRDSFEQLWTVALDESTSRELLAKHAESALAAARHKTPG